MAELSVKIDVSEVKEYVDEKISEIKKDYVAREKIDEVIEQLEMRLRAVQMLTCINPDDVFILNSAESAVVTLKECLSVIHAICDI